MSNTESHDHNPHLEPTPLAQAIESYMRSYENYVPLVDGDVPVLPVEHEQVAPPDWALEEAGGNAQLAWLIEEHEEVMNGVVEAGGYNAMDPEVAETSRTKADSLRAKILQQKINLGLEPPRE
jgi:hypothetical protein